MVELNFCLYQHKKDNEPNRESLSWPELAELLTEFDERKQKDGPLWSPAIICEGGKRTNGDVVSVSCLVLDFDEGHEWAQFVDMWRGLEFVLHTTFQHTDEAPRWRAVFPLVEPVHALDWPDVYRKLVTHLACGVCDPSCKDASRMYYLPSHPPGGERFAELYTGRTLDPSLYEDVPLEESLPDVLQPPPRSGEGLRPGDDFNTRATWDEILLAHGWQRPNWRTGERVSWTRPGKTLADGASAVTGGARHGDRFYCFSSSVKDVPTGKLLDKFALYAHLNHRGDFAEAARTLGRSGYGEKPGAVAVAEQPAEEFSFSDLGNAERFIAMFGDRVRFCHRFGRWLTWNGRFWDIDQTGGAPVYQMVAEMVRGMKQDAANMDKDRGQKLWAWANSCESKAKTEALLSMAQRLRGVPVTPEDLDKRPMQLVCLNGTYDFEKDEFYEGYFDPSGLTTKGLSVPYDENAECPMWEKMLATVLPDVDVLHYMWKACGYALTGSTVEQVFFFLYGTGKNGKTTFVEVLQALFGEYSKKTPTETLLVKNNQQNTASNDVARLRGARLVIASELESGRRLNESLIKDLTGGDTLTARFLHQEFFEFKLEAKILMFGNHKPMIRGTDEGIWRRVALIPFTVHIPVEDRIAGLGDTIIEKELAGVLAWAIQGFKAYRVVGLNQPAVILDAVSEYREEQDVLGAFLDECTESKPMTTVSSTKLHEVYTRWAKNNSEHVMSKKFFSIALKDRGWTIRKSNGVMVVDNLVLSADALGWLREGN